MRPSDLAWIDAQRRSCVRMLYVVNVLFWLAFVATTWEWWIAIRRGSWLVGAMAVFTTVCVLHNRWCAMRLRENIADIDEILDRAEIDYVRLLPPEEWPR